MPSEILVTIIDEENFLNIFPDYDIESDEENVTKTVSKCFFTLDKLKEEYKYSENYLKNVEELKKKYLGWRKSRGDGNCYYRSVITTYMIKIFYFNNTGEELSKFIQKLELILENDDLWDYHENAERIMPFFKEAFSNWEIFEKRVCSFIEINHKLQDEEFDQDIIQISRVIASFGIQKMAQDPAFSAFMVDSIDILKQNILKMGREAESDELLALPLGLEICVTQINFLENRYLENIFNKHENNSTGINVSIISKSRGHYDCLFSKQDAEDLFYYMQIRKYYLHNNN